ncbi:hypothetical protein [Rivularia sp. UHCC 0363]|uniref:hypothetical protein n=1 Tax=Rivularia sp. UHCC 0363 TaxID=3110244 RepID=UPI002B21AC59|nr:hypothetical protein [Rivularia sp. UHCC 0363]MEA5597866.1 hypothetical protein [Rivularia sp. UHCC 0363]
MNINDLETCEVVFGNQVIGGNPKTYVKGSAKAKPGYANANVVAVAVGDSTSTKTATGASVSPTYGSDFFAGSAVAKTGTKYDLSYDSGYDYGYQK